MKEPKYSIYDKETNELLFETNSTHHLKDFMLKYIRENNELIKDCYRIQNKRKKPRKIGEKKSTKECKDEAWEWFSIYIRLRDSDENGYIKCVTCGKIAFWKGEGMQAGHYVSGRNNKVLLHPKLVYGQCDRCNIFLGGNEIEYTKAMKKKGFSDEELELFRNMKNEKSKRDRNIWEWEAKNWKEKAEYEAIKRALDI